MLLIDRALETAYLIAGLAGSGATHEIVVGDRLAAGAVGADAFAVISTAEVTLLTATHRVDPTFGIWVSESGAIAMRAPVRPDQIDATAILLYDVSGTAELLARATLWPFYGIKATAWTTEADGSSAVTIVEGIDALEPVEAGFDEDLVRAWFILTEQPVVTHLLAIPIDADSDAVSGMRSLLRQGIDSGYAGRREVRKDLLADTRVENDELVDYLSRVRYELDEMSRPAAYSLIARGSGGTRFPLLRELPWWSPNGETDGA